MSRQVCTVCNVEPYFDAWADQDGDIVSTFDSAFCPNCDGACSVKTVPDDQVVDYDD